MIQITIKIDGMQCGMCESHVNDSIRRAFPVKKVTESINVFIFYGVLFFGGDFCIMIKQAL